MVREKKLHNVSNDTTWLVDLTSCFYLYPFQYFQLSENAQ